MSVNKTPGVYVQEIAKLPPSIAEVETAIPVFIGYTEKKVGDAGEDLRYVPTRVTSLLEFEKYFGGPFKELFNIELVETVKVLDTAPTPDTFELVSRNVIVKSPPIVSSTRYTLYYHMQLFFANGGGPCYIVSTGGYNITPLVTDYLTGLQAVEKLDEPTLLLFPDAATNIDADQYATLGTQALEQCNKLMDRFTILDAAGYDFTLDDFRSAIGNNFLKYGAAYYPNLATSLSFGYDINLQKITTHKRVTTTGTTLTAGDPEQFPAAQSLVGKTLAEIGSQPLKDMVISGIQKIYVKNLAPSAAVAGRYAQVDNDRGVWKAPANVSLNLVTGLTDASGAPINIDDQTQDGLNVDPIAGKSINAIRAFLGKGIIIWGARTLAGNDNEWRYVPVRRLYNYVEESCKKSTSWAVFEPNDANTWLRIKSQIENFLNNLWRDGALAGAKPEQAYYVSVGLGSTMTAQDILEGRMIVEIGMAAVRPAEFIVLKFSHLLQQS